MRKRGAEAAEAVIELQNVWKTYRVGETTIQALRGVDLKIKRGEFVAQSC